MQKNYKKSLRQSQTDVERIIWYHLKNRNMKGFKFRRQHVLLNYIVDFFCYEKNLIIELDGGQHMDQKVYDDKRTQLLEDNGYKVIRFWNNEVLEDIDSVLGVIYSALEV